MADDNKKTLPSFLFEITPEWKILSSKPHCERSGEAPSADLSLFDLIDPRDHRKLEWCRSGIYQVRFGHSDPRNRYTLCLVPEPDKPVSWASAVPGWSKESTETEHGELLALLELQQRELVKRRKAVNHFLSNMGHELRTPLTAILGLSEALAVELYGASTEQQKSAARTINECGKSLLGLLNDIIDVTKLEVGRSSFRAECLTAREIADSVLRLLRKETTEKSMEVALRIEGEDFRFAGDRKRIKQSLTTF